MLATGLVNVLAQTAASPTGGWTWGYAGTVAMVMVFLLACLLLILTVLIQKPQGGGLAGAFGSGAGSGQTAFGTRTGDALTVATIIMFVFYLTTAIVLTFMIRPSTAPTAEELEAGAVPAGATAPAETKGTESKPAAQPTPIQLTPIAPPQGAPATPPQAPAGAQPEAPKAPETKPVEAPAAPVTPAEQPK